MDSLTHTVIGACLGDAIAGKKLGKKAMLIGALANNLPDIDVITSIWTDPAAELLAHRGITHSILFALIMTPLLVYFFKKRFQAKDLSTKKWYLLIASGLFLHIFMDACTAYGTGWFEPFNHARVSFNTLFILDPFFAIPMIICSIALLIINKNSYPRRTWWSLSGLSISLLYLLVTFGFKLSIMRFIEKDLSSKNISYNEYMATPTAMNNLLWYSVVKSNSDFYVGYRSLLDRSGSMTWEYYTKNDSLLIPFHNSNDIQNLKQFSKGYYTVTKQDSTLIFSDMRFGQLVGWEYKQAPFVFNFNLIHTQGNATKLQQGRFKSIQGRDLSLLIERIKGN